MIDLISFRRHLTEIDQLLCHGICEKIIAIDFNRFSFVFQLTPPRKTALYLNVGQPPQLFVTDEKFPVSPQTINVMLALNKYLLGARLTGVKHLGVDYVARLDFVANGWERNSVSLIVELCAGKPNLILINAAGQIIDLKTKVPAAKNRYRTLLPGELYVPPPPLPLKNPFELTLADWTAAVQKNPYAYVWGLKDFIWEEIGADFTGLQKLIQDAQKELWLYEIDGAYQLSPLKLSKYQPLQNYATVNAAILDYYQRYFPLYQERKTQALHALHLRQRRAKLLKLCLNLEKDQQQAAQALTAQGYGELIHANLAQAKITGDSLELWDYYQEPPALVSITVDPLKTLLENAQAFFSAAKRAKRGLSLIAARLLKTRAEIAEIERQLAALPMAGQDLRAAKETRPLPLPPERKTNRQLKEERKYQHIYRFIRDENFEFWVGKNQTGNEKLLKMATGNDYWLHVLGYSGSHVVLKSRLKNQEAPLPVLLEAAALAAYYSQARTKDKVEVDYTRRKYVRKQKGKVAAVTYSQQKTLLVTPKQAFDNA